MNRTRRLSAALVAVAFIVPCVVATGASAKKATLKVATSQKKALQRDGLQVKVKGLKTKGKKKAKVKIKARSSTFDQQDLRNLTKAAKVRTKKKSAVALLQLTNNGRKSITSCESRKIVISGKGVKKAKVQLKRNTKECKPKPIDLSRADDCNFIGVQEGSLCMLPFPDDYYTVKDSSSSTGRRIAFTDGGMPQNEDGKPIAAEPYNLNDGFSPGQVITLKVPGLDNPEALTKTNPIPLADLSRNESQDSKEPIVVIDAETGKRTPIWVEIDSNASTPSSTALLIHAATQFEAGHRYIVAMRKLKDSSGNKLAAPEGFRYYRDDLPSNEAAINDQRKRMDKVFRALRKVKVKRANLYLAWDFTVSSDENVAQRMLHIRNDAFAQLGDTNLGDGVVEGTAPAFAIDTVANNPNPGIARRVTGTFTVPCYLTNSCEAPAVFTLDSSGNPIRQGNYQANFDCIIPDAAVATPGRPSLYGHGLLGSAGEVGSAPQRSLANTHNFVFCATDEIGFANEDIGNTIGILGDLGRFPELTDRTQQGLLNELFLGRLMIHPDGFAERRGLPADGTDGPAGDQHVEALLQRQQPGRHPRRRADGDLARLHPSLARGAGDGLLDPADAVDRLRDLLADPLPVVSERALAAAGAVADPDALGPLGGERLRAPDDRQPAAGHPPARGADEHRLRRPPGHHLAGRRAGAHDRGQHPHAGRLRRALARRRRRLGHPDDLELSVQRLGDRLLGRRSGPPRPGEPRRGARHRSAAAHQHAEHQRRGPARPPPGDARGAADGLGLPAPGRAEPDHRHLQRRALLLDRLQRPIAAGDAET